MTDVPPPAPQPVSAVPAPSSEIDARTWVIIVYALYLGAIVCGGASGIAGVIMAYIKRDEFRGTIWESHLENAIRTFWVWFILFVAGIPLCLIFVGIFVIIGAFIYFLFRTIKGLIAAIDGKPYV